MIKLAGLWELGWNTPIKEVDLWEMVLRDFGVDRLLMSPVTGIVSKYIQEYHDMMDMIVEYRGSHSIVFVDEAGKVPLTKFDHPENALYVFGKATLSPLVAYSDPDDQSVFIETNQNQGLLWPHQAAAIILYDRLVKSWQ